MALVVVTACKKDEPEEVITDSAPVQQLSTDDKNVEDNIDEVIIDVGLILNSNLNLKNAGMPCNASLDTVISANDSLYYHLRYNGLNCIQNKHREGLIIMKMKEGSQWHIAGEKMNLEFHDYEITNVYNGRQLLINGKSRLENVSGGAIPLLGSTVTSLIYRNTAYLNVTFDNSTSSLWRINKSIVFSGTPEDLVMAVNGFGSVGDYDKLISWGKDRDGNDFYNQVIEWVTFREKCNWVPFTGEQLFSIPEEGLKATVTYGFNNQNQPIAGSECPTRYRLRWQQYGQSGTIFLPVAGK
jgi:hypothetical protein